MSHPRLFLHLHSKNLHQEFMQLDALQRFVTTQSTDLAPWAEQVRDLQPDIAIIEVLNEQEVNAQALVDEELLDSVEFLFISDGKPNRQLDKIMLRGAGYHFRQPVDGKLISETLDDFFEQLSETQPGSERALSSELDQFGLLVGSSRPMRKLYRTIRRVAATEANVLIIGESGSGKELVARTLHSASQHAQGPYVAINCGAISPELIDSELFGHLKGAFTGADRQHEGVFAQAKGGTLFLDEVTEMPLEHQVKLLRVLETGGYRPVGSKQEEIADVRVIAATNRDPAKAIDEEQLREDLYFRLAEFPVSVPPLRERGDDIIGLAKHFLAYRNSAEHSNVRISTEALEKIARHTWPGNVRELKHTIERAYILADDMITADQLVLDPVASDDYPLGASDHIPSGMPLEDLERIAIFQALEENGGNKTDTAKQLGISVKTLYNKLEKYDQEDLGAS